MMRTTSKALSLTLAGAALLLTASIPAVAGDGPYTIGLGQPNVEHPYRVGGTNRAKAWAAEHPDLIKQLIVVDGRRDSATQLNGLEDLLVRGVDALVMSPNDSNALAPIAPGSEAQERAIVVFDRKLNVSDDLIAAYVGGDNVEMGRVAGRYIADKLGGKGVVDPA